MKKDALTPRRRWLAAIRMQPVDRLPFWPKLGGGYARVQADPFRGMELAALHDWIGSDRHEGIGGCWKETRRRTSAECRKTDGTRRTVFRTPHGDTEQIERFDEPSQAWHPMRFPVQTVEHVRWMTDFWSDANVEPDPDACRKTQERKREIGETAVTAFSIGESPLMHWVEHLAGIENAQYLLADHTQEVETLFDAMHRVLLRRTEIAASHHPADLLYFTENTSTTLISPDQYRRHCLRHLTAYGEILRAADRNLVLHMCGHLKALLPDLARVPARAFEAFTSPTLGNTTLLDGRTACPDTCLVGGTNAMLWLRPAKEIVAQIEKALIALPHHRGIVLTSAGVMPPRCAPETIRTVCAWVHAYPARM
jgi:hypothetical protein